VVVLEGRAVGVVRVAVCFDDHLLGRPVEVDENVLDQDIDLRERQTELTTEGEEVDLQGRGSIGGARIHFHSDATQAADSPLPLSARDHSL